MSKPKGSVLRVHRRRRGWTAVDNTVVRDRQLSYKARGILVYLLSHDDGWHWTAESLADESDPDGRTAVLSGLKELRAAGYLRYHKRQGEHGHWITESVVSEEPSLTPPESENPTPDRSRENRHPVTRPSTEDHPEDLDTRDGDVTGPADGPVDDERRLTIAEIRADRARVLQEAGS